MAKITYKIDRLSNSSLQFGLKTNATLTGSSLDITSSKLLKYGVDVTSQILDDAHIPNKKYVDDKVTNLNSDLVNYIKSYFVSGERIKFTPDENTLTISLGNAYEDGSAKVFESSDSKQVISAVHVDKYGTVTSVDYKTISTADLENTDNVFDNYEYWQLKVGSETANIESAWRKADDQTAVVPVEFVSDGSIAFTLTSATSNLVTFSLKVNEESDYPLYVDPSTGLNLRTISGFENGKAEGLYKIGIDKFGRITSATTASSSDFASIIPYHTETTDGIVKHINTSAGGNSTDAPESGVNEYFYTSKAKWTKIPYNTVLMSSATGSNTVQLLGTLSTENGLVTTVSNNKLTFIPDSGILSATRFSGDGSSLTNLSASALTGTLNSSVIPTIDQSKLNLGLSQPGAILYTNASNRISEITNPTTPVENTNFVLTKLVTASGGGISDAPQWVDIKNLVTNIVAGEGGLTFQGTIGSSSDNATLENLPTSFTKGYFYKIVTTGTYIGKYLEKGDTIYAIKDSDSGYAVADDTTKQSYWSVLQGNLDNAVTFNNVQNVTSGILPIKAASQTVISDAVGLSATKSGDTWSLTTDISGNAATASALKKSVNIWGQTFDGSEGVSGDLTNVGNITPDGTNKIIGSVASPFSKAYITTVVGNLEGSASSAQKTVGTLTIGGKTFNGSDDVTVNLTAADLGLVSNVSLGAASGNGNFISALEFTKGADGVVTVTPTLNFAISSIESSIFSISSTSGKATISRLTQEADGAIYKTASPLPTISTAYGFGGILTAYDLRVVRGDISKRVAVLGNGTDASPSGKKVLVADSTSSDYGFIKTEISIEANPTWSSDNQIPTAGAVNDKLSEIQAAVTAGGVKCIKVDLTNTASSSTNSVPSGAIIEHIDVYVQTAYGENSTLSVNVGGTTYINTSDIDLTVSDESFTYKISKPSSTGGTVVGNINVGTSGTVGALSIYVYYVQPLV